MNHTEHFLNLLDLLKKEREEDRKQYENKIRNRSLDDRKREGVTWYPVIVEQSFLGTGEKWVLKITRTNDHNKRHFFQAGSSVSIFLNDPKKIFSTSGIISRVNEKYMTIVLNRDDPPEWLKEGKVGVDLLFDESTYDEMDKAMKKLASAREGRIIELIKIFLGESAPAFNKSGDIRHPKLNDSQNSALSLINAAKDVALVHGPPGTGKTTTLVEAIKETVSIEKQVLVSAASNAAVDLLAEKLSQHDIRVLRIGHPARVTDEVVSSTIDARLAQHQDAKLLRDLRKQAEEYRELGRKHKRNFGPAERKQRKMLLDEARNIRDDARMLEEHMIFDELNKAQVIACTLIGSNSTIIQNRSYKTLFIDEASQALEPASWIPIMKAQRVVMAGDHWQLPPTVKSLEAAKQGLSNTLFERIIKHWNADTMLKTQYRMHDQIMSFSNNKFYNNELTSGEIIQQRRQLFDEPIIYIDTAGCSFDEKINPETLSTYNEEEGQICLKMLNNLLSSLPEEKKLRLKIGIIAPYRAQTEILRNSLENQPLDKNICDNITINSVDAFQGQERDIILISLTRSNPNGEIGFLSNIRRMNVAMTRAKHLLILVGDSATLSSNNFFDQLIQDIQKRGYYHSAFEYLYD